MVKTLSNNKGYFLGFPWGLLACRRLSWLPPCNGRETEEGHFVETAKTLSPAYPPFHFGHRSRTLCPEGHFAMREGYALGFPGGKLAPAV